MQELIMNTKNLPVPQIAQPSFLNDKEACIALFSLLEALSYEMISGDVWWLAGSNARDIAVNKYGISEEAYDQTMAKFDEARKAKGRTNPFNSMF